MKQFLLKVTAIFALFSTFSKPAEACTCMGTQRICQYLQLYPQSTFFKVRIDTMGTNPVSDFGVTVLDQFHGTTVISPTYWFTSENMGSCAGFLPPAAQVGDTFLLTLFSGSGADTGSLWTCSFIQPIINDSVYEMNQPSFPISDLQDSIDACREVSAKHIDLATAIQVYPNPVREMLHIDNRSGAAILSVQLSDITGRKVLFQEGKDLHSIPVGQMNSGLYFLQIKTDKGILSRKIHIAE